jgi:hypothetical protein
MTKLASLSTTALCALALVAGVTPAAAAAGSDDIFGAVNFGYDWTNYDPSVVSDFHTNTFLAQGAFGVPIGNGWSLQGNFAFETQQFDDFGLPVSFAIDTWQVGGVVAYDFDNEGRLGFDLAYESIDVGVSADGYRAGVRGEYYWLPEATLRANLGWQDYETDGLELDGFYGGIGGSWYFSRNLAVRANIDYYTYDLSFGPFGIGDYDVWDFGAKLQYKLDEYPIVLGGHVNYGTIDFAGLDSDAWVLGVDITALFGSDAADSSLRDAENNSTFTPIRTGVKYFSF